MKVKFLIGLVSLSWLLALAACGGGQKATPTLVSTLPALEPTVAEPTVVTEATPPATATSRPVPTAQPTPEPPPAYRVSFEPFGCAFVVPAGQKVECGYLVVPEDRSKPDSPSIRLAVAILRHPDGQPEPDPIVYLTGGPGVGALEFLSQSFEPLFQPVLAANRDVILLDQRGVGLSKPQLDCPVFERLSLDLLDYEYKGRQLVEQEVMALSVKTLQICGQELSQVADLAAYNTVASAADVNDLRRALGYDQVNLWGISYGTRLALQVMRDYPWAVRSAVLDSVYPPDVDAYAQKPANADRAFDVLFEKCAADDACNARYPNLRAVFFDTVARLDERPLLIPVVHPATGESYDVLLDGELLVGLTYQALHITALLPDLPQLLYQTSQGNYRPIADIAGMAIAHLESTNTGLHFSVQCREEVPFSDREEFEAALVAYPELDGFFESFVRAGWVYEVCEGWESGVADPLEKQAVVSDVPTLIVTGEYDPVSPPAWAQHVAEALSHHYYFEYPGLGHALSAAHRCPQQMMVAFWVDPTTVPDAACIAGMASP